MNHVKVTYIVVILVLTVSGAITAMEKKQSTKKEQGKLLLQMWHQGMFYRAHGQHAQAFEIFKKVYDDSRSDPSNHARAAQSLGEAYLFGFGVTKNPAESHDYFIKAYKLSRYAPEVRTLVGMYLGILYRDGLGVKQDFAESLKYFDESYRIDKELREKNHLIKSIDLQSDLVKEREKLLRLMGDQGYKYIENKQYGQAFELFTKVYNNSPNDSMNHLVAAFYLGAMYDKGWGTEPNRIMALKYFNEVYSSKYGPNHSEIYARAVNKLGELTEDSTESLKYFLEAYKVSDNLPNLQDVHAGAAGNLGRIYMSLRQYTDDTKRYLLEAYDFGKKDDKKLFAFAANALGLLYANGLGGVEEDNDKAIEYFEGAYTSGDSNIRTAAAHNLGRIYLYNQIKQNYSKALKYLEDATTSDESYIRESAIQDLYTLKIMLLAKCDHFITEVEDGLISTSSEHLRSFLKQAWKSLQDAGEITMSFGALRDLKLSNIIDDEYDKFHKAEELFRHRKGQEIQPQSLVEIDTLHGAEKALNNNDLEAAKKLLSDFKKLDSKNIDSRKKFKGLAKIYTQLKLSNMLATFDKLFADYLAQPNNETIEKADNLLSEAAELAAKVDDKATLSDISNNRGKLYKKRSETKKVLPSREEEKKVTPIGQQETYVILDPFSQRSSIPHEFRANIESHLQKLAADYLNIRGAEKIKALKYTWRIEAGDYRILYTVLPKYSAIGIVAIDDRKNVYKAPEQGKNHEEWFQKYNNYTAGRIYEDIQRKRKESHGAKEIALIKLYLRIPKDQSSNTQRQELLARLKQLEQEQHAPTAQVIQPAIPAPQIPPIQTFQMRRPVYEEGRSALANHDYQGALEQFEVYRKMVQEQQGSDPELLEAQHGIAQSYLGLATSEIGAGNIEQARQYLAHAEALDRNMSLSTEIRNLRGRITKQERDQKE